MLNFQQKRDFIQLNLIKIFDILIIPNISITQEDQEEYEEDPDAYIRNDLDEQDTETRRRHCMKFVNQLSARFPQEVNSLIENYINSYIGEYQANR
jgi:exportin-2 (importin alpha re-exporter)